MTLLVGRQEGRSAFEWWGAGMVICLERGADLHAAQLMSLPLTVSCFSKIQIGFTFLVPAHPGSSGQGAVKRVYVCMSQTYTHWDVIHNTSHHTQTLGPLLQCTESGHCYSVQNLSFTHYTISAASVKQISLASHELV